MDYVGHIIRPPSEAKSLLIQTTVGCSHNRCTFCGVYKNEHFRVKDKETVMADIDEAASMGIPFQKVFFPDGDALAMDTEHLLEIITKVKQQIPTITRAGVYGNVRAIMRKSQTELNELQSAGLSIVYHGVESGNDTVLRRIRKGALPKHIIEASEKIKNAGIRLSQTVLLGLGGTDLSRDHAIDTGKLLSATSPDFASALTVMLLPNTKLYHDEKSGTFSLPGKMKLIEELRTMIEYLNPKRPCYFASNHASNYLPITGHLPGEKNRILELLDTVLESGDESQLKPDSFRAL